MDAVGGVLVHVFDAPTHAYYRWAYSILDEEEWASFRFKAAYWPWVKKLLNDLIDQSADQNIWFYSDAQLSNPTSLDLERVTLDDFIRLHDSQGVPMNRAFNLGPT